MNVLKCGVGVILVDKVVNYGNVYDIFIFKVLDEVELMGLIGKVIKVFCDF